MYCSDSKPPTPRKRRISYYIFHFILVILVVVVAMEHKKLPMPKETVKKQV